MYHTVSFISSGSESTTAGCTLAFEFFLAALFGVYSALLYKRNVKTAAAHLEIFCAVILSSLLWQSFSFMLYLYFKTFPWEQH